jgi:muramoyltetrapeptide carboxypeptidase
VNSCKKQILKSPALRPGGKIGLIAPAGSFNRESMEAGCDRLRQMGYEPVYSSRIVEREGYFAGSVERRLRELEEMVSRDDVAALICVRGGYGSNYVLENLNFEVFTRRPKIMLGCSDVTSLLTAITDRTGLVTFHGPMVAKDISAGNVELSSWNNALQGVSQWSIPNAGMEVLRVGRAHGELYGGCLSLLVASLGTPFEIHTDGTILFIEDVDEKPYRVDRMLMQLRQAGKLERVRGVIFGEMLGCAQPGVQDYTLQQVIMRVLARYDVPIAYGLRSGHVSADNVTLPIGIMAELVAESAGVELKIMESATIVR